MMRVPTRTHNGQIRRTLPPLFALVCPFSHGNDISRHKMQYSPEMVLNIVVLFVLTLTPC